MISRRDSVIFGLLSIVGLSFWFALGFPFEHHNESYAWLPALKAMNFKQSLTGIVGPVVTPRPLGILVAWGSFKIAGGSIALVELSNFALALCAWFLLFDHTTFSSSFSTFILM